MCLPANIPTHSQRTSPGVAKEKRKKGWTGDSGTPINRGLEFARRLTVAEGMVEDHHRSDSGKKWETGREVLDKVSAGWHNVRPRIRNQSSGRIAQMVRAQL